MRLRYWKVSEGVSEKVRTKLTAKDADQAKIKSRAWPLTSILATSLQLAPVLRRLSINAAIGPISVA